MCWGCLGAKMKGIINERNVRQNGIEGVVTKH